MDLVDRENKLFHVVSKDKGEVIEEGKKTMISNYIQGEGHLRFISLLSKFPKLFINVYSQVIGEDGIKHHIKLNNCPNASII